MWFIRIMRFYKQELWTKEQVADAVSANKISIKEYKEITGEGYIETDKI